MKKFVCSIILLLILIGCEESKPPQVINNSNQFDLSADQISWNVTVFFYDSSFTKAILRADKARIYQTRAETLLDDNVIVEFFSKETNKRASRLTADSARVDDKTKDMIARGRVIVISDKNQTKLETSVLYWNNQTQKMYSPEFVRINSPKEKIQGYGFESDQNLNNYRIFKVSGEQR